MAFVLTRTHRCAIHPRTRLSWIKRRARCLAQAFLVSRAEAVESAALDWAYFQPGTTVH